MIKQDWKADFSPWPLVNMSPKRFDDEIVKMDKGNNFLQ